MYDELYSDENISVLAPDFLDDYVLYSSSEEDSELEESEDLESGEESNIDYSSDFDDVNSSLESLMIQVDNLNENVCVVNENLKFCIGLTCAIVFFLVVKTCSYILNTILGLGKA